MALTLTPQEVRDLRVVFDVFATSGSIHGNDLRKAIKVRPHLLRQCDVTCPPAITAGAGVPRFSANPGGARERIGPERQFEWECQL